MLVLILLIISLSVLFALYFLTAPVPETQTSISSWADETFGPTTLQRSLDRASEEFLELIADVENGNLDHAKVELADLHICLARVGTKLNSDIQNAVDAKMKINRKRAWKVDGTGCGYHVK